MHKLIIGLVVGLLVGATSVRAVTPIGDADLLNQIKASFVAAGWTPPSTTPVTPPVVLNSKPTDITGNLWTIMAPFSKPGTTSSPENLYISDAQTDSRYTPYLFMRDNAVVFKTFVNGVHSPNSDYPRSELREMKDLNWGEASWSDKTGNNILTTRQAITHEPVVKPEVVSAQIHNGSDDVIQIFLQGNKLYVRYNNDNSLALMDANYVLGTPYDLVINASGGHIKVSYNGVQKLDWSKSGSGYYFKEGSYCQSNVSKGDAPDAYCEVEVYSLAVTH